MLPPSSCRHLFRELVVDVQHRHGHVRARPRCLKGGFCRAWFSRSRSCRICLCAGSPRPARRGGKGTRTRCNATSRKGRAARAGSSSATLRQFTNVRRLVAVPSGMPLPFPPLSSGRLIDARFSGRMLQANFAVGLTFLSPQPAFLERGTAEASEG